ncbi:MAG TPA: hypothetical protein IAC50_06595 [Candidatus Copromorpha excrementigallinarum]|uniref:Uncharacterized protein n=1 Tax=Candidatus Allocopromorpha excrementigallinarum TaxID=2840742 RepID=A0A9D1I0W5_9FIRM|nr:hypothetical protein [Candidatus Copromorpha excrementigallinarum]
MGEVLWSDISRILTPAFLALWVSFLLDFRKPERITKALCFFLIAVLIFLNLLFLFLADDRQIYVKSWPLTLTLPYVLLLLLTTVKKSFRSLFAILTVMFWGCVVAMIGVLAGKILGYPWADPAVRVILFLLMLPLINYYKNTYRAMIHLMKKGWFILIIIPVLLTASLYFLNTIVSYDSSPALYLAAVLTGFLGASIYAFLYVFFRKLMMEQIYRQHRDMLAAQAEELEERARSSAEVRQKLAIFRHDLKHYINMISAQIENGNPRGALVTLEDARSKFSETLSDNYERDDR